MIKTGIVTSDEVFNKNKMFDIDDNPFNRDNVLQPFYDLKENLNKKNILMNTLDMYESLSDLDAIFFFKLDRLELFRILKSGYNGKLIYFAWEPPVVSKENSAKGLKKLEGLFDYIMTWNDDLVDNEKYIKIHYPQPFSEASDFESSNDFHRKKLLVSISMDKSSKHSSELYSERKNVIFHYENYNSEVFDFYGMLWEKDRYKNYKGRCENKSDVYSNYRFAICFENMRDINGYISEKIFDCFQSGIVPIYYGATNISNYVPENCYIDYSKFNSISEMHSYIDGIDKETHNSYLENINAFLLSDKRQLFEETHLRQQISDVLNRDSSPLKMNLKNRIKLSFYYYFNFKQLKKRFLDQG